MLRAFLAVVLVVSLSAGASAAEEAEGDLILTIKRVKSGRGYLRVALCSSPEQYRTDRDIFRTAGVRPEKGETEVVFRGIPYGLYAVKVYHDKNGNDKLDKGFFGIPKERYGFSNDPKIRGGMPPYDEAAFEVGSKEEYRTINLR